MNKKNDPRPIYRIVFVQQDKIEALYAQYISEETLVGFIEADGILNIDDTKDMLNLKEVRRCYIPLHTIVRIDEVTLEHVSESQDNISHLPHAFKKSTSTVNK